MFAFVKEGLEDKFNTTPRDAVKARKSLLRGIDATLDQFNSGRTKVPNKWWAISNGVVAFSPILHRQALVLNGQTTNHVEAEDFPAFMAAFRSAVEAGELDGEIEAIESGAGVAGQSVAVKPKGGRGTISPEAAKLRGQTAAATRARNKAAREAGNA